MGRKIVESLLSSLEWRFYAFIITAAFLWATTGEFAFSALQALGLQVVLFVGHSIWYYMHTSEGPHRFTLDALASRIAGYLYRSLVSHGRQ